MGDLKIKAASGGDLILQEDGGSAALTIDTSGDTTVSGDLNPGSGPANFVGMIAPFAKSSGTIDGWLYCDGSTLNSVSDTQYANLYSVIGITWGGSSSSSFKIPDLEGAFLRGTGSHGTSNMANGSAFAGPSVGSFENDQFQGHLFGDVSSTYTSSATEAPLKIKDGNKRNKTPSVVADNNHGAVDVQAGSYGDALIPISDQTNGNPRTGDETRPFNAGVRYYIKY